MNGVHDMGGMTCFGPIEREDDEPVFHSDWERRAFALSIASSRLFGPIDRRRHAIERMAPGYYLRSSYYELWLARLVAATRELGLLSDAELSTGITDPGRRAEPGSEPAAADPPPGPEFFAAIIRDGVPATRATGRLEPRFAVGDRVRARNLNPPGHTRLPRYVRGRRGKVVRHHGTHVFPDSNAHGEGENPQPLYCVGFAATELWGPNAPAADHVCVDLWEDYLEAAGA